MPELAPHRPMPPTEAALTALTFLRAVGTIMGLPLRDLAEALVAHNLPPATASGGQEPGPETQPCLLRLVGAALEFQATAAGILDARSLQTSATIQAAAFPGVH